MDLITTEDARSHAAWLLEQIESAVGEGRPLSDDAVSIAADLADWVSAVADTGISVN